MRKGREEGRVDDILGHKLITCKYKLKLMVQSIISIL